MSTNILWIPVTIGFAIYAAAVGIDTVTPKGPTQASLKSLTFEEGLFTQEFYITGEGFLDMHWAAEINRGSVQLCSGGGIAPYRSETPKVFPPDKWTFDDCPQLQAGDEAFAVWSYTDQTGLRHKFEATLTITEDML